MKKTPKPSQRERVALFRHSVIGDLLAQELNRGELELELQQRAKKRYRPPGSRRTRNYHWKTLQRWYYASKHNAVSGLMPRSRSRGQAMALSAEQREMLLQMRREHPSASAQMVLSEAVRNGVVQEDCVSVSTLRRLYAAAGMPRVSMRRAVRNDLQRRRWQAAKPGDLWHGDVCHLLQTDETGRPWRPLVHGLLDDASRYAPALAGRLQERERDMLEVFCGALLRHPPPKTLYLDNGSCYSGVTCWPWSVSVSVSASCMRRRTPLRPEAPRSASGEPCASSAPTICQPQRLYTTSTRPYGRGSTPAITERRTRA